MRKTGFRKSLILLVISAALVLAVAGCGNNLSSGTELTTIDPMSFTAIDNRIRDYNFGINEYMREHSAEATQKVTSGATPGGVPAECTYTISPDGKYESLQMQKALDNAVQIDEYFNLGDAVFFARTTVYNDGSFDPVEKYYIIDGTLYKIDGSAESVMKVVDLSDASAETAKANLDMYFSFDEIRELYA